MARPLRVEFAGALYHVMSRGNDRRAIVKDDADRQRRIDWLRRTVETYGWRLLAFVLMDNHEHLFLETPEPNLSAGMQHLNGSYTGYYNFRHNRSGHLFQGRFKAHLVDNAGYYQEVSRYIHLNPVRAGLVKRPEDWRWGSYRGYHRAAWAVPWIRFEQVLREFARDPQTSRREYRQFVAEGIDSMPPPPWRGAVAGLVIGGERFVEKVRHLLRRRSKARAVPVPADLRNRPSLERIVSAAAGRFGTDAAGWTPGRRADDGSRAVAAYLARRRYGYAVTQIADALGYASHGGVVAAIRRVESAGAKLLRMARELEKELSSD
jgi:putative transposase